MEERASAIDWTPTEGELIAMRVDRLLKQAEIRNSLGVSPPADGMSSWTLFVQGGDGSGEARAALSSIPGVSKVCRLPATGAGIIYFDLDPAQLPPDQPPAAAAPPL